MIGMIVSAASKAVGGYFENKSKESQAKSDLKIAEIEAKTAVQKKVAEGKVEWINKAMGECQLLILGKMKHGPFIIALIVCAFVPDLQPYVAESRYSVSIYLS